MRRTRWADTIRVIVWIVFAVLIGVAVIAVMSAFGLGLDWSWTYKRWLPRGLGILALGYVVVAVIYYVGIWRAERGVADLYASPFGQSGYADTIVIPHKATPAIAIISGLLAILSLSATMVLITNFSEATLGLTVVYIAVGVLGITSFGLGLLVSRNRSKALNALRSEWWRLQEPSPIRTISDELRRRIAKQRDALLISGDLIDADRATTVLRSLTQPSGYESAESKWMIPEDG